MDKHELVEWLKAEHRQFQSLLEEIGPARMALPGVAAHWSVKDILAHMSGWHPIAAWPAAGRAARRTPAAAALACHLYKPTTRSTPGFMSVNRERPLSEILAETHQQMQQLLALLEALPDDVRIEDVHHQEKAFTIWSGFG
jgi:hypothetical protein